MSITSHIWKWFNKFPFTIICATLSAIFWVKPDLIPGDLLLTHFFNNDFVAHFWLIVLAPFFYDLSKTIRLKYRLRKLRNASGKRSKKVWEEEGYSPACVGIDMVSLVAMIGGLLVVNIPEAATPKYYEAEFYEKIFNVIIMPALSTIIYYTKYQMQKKKPNHIINSFEII